MENTRGAGNAIPTMDISRVFTDLKGSMINYIYKISLQTKEILGRTL